LAAAEKRAESSTVLAAEYCSVPPPKEIVPPPPSAPLDDSTSTPPLTATVPRTLSPASTTDPEPITVRGAESRRFDATVSTPSPPPNRKPPLPDESGPERATLPLAPTKSVG
jgi:hypothetical protein